MAKSGKGDSKGRGENSGQGATSKAASASKPVKLTNKQRKLVKGIADGKTQREAARKAGITEQHACELLKKPEIIETIQTLMAKHGLDDVSLLKKHAELLDATKTVSAVSGRDAGADSVDFVDVPDWQARAKGLEMAYKLKGAFTEKREVTGKDGGAQEHTVTVAQGIDFELIRKQRDRAHG